jgi:hypothetical protein
VLLWQPRASSGSLETTSAPFGPAVLRECRQPAWVQCRVTRSSSPSFPHTHTRTRLPILSSSPHHCGEPCQATQLPKNVEQESRDRPLGRSTLLPTSRVRGDDVAPPDVDAGAATTAFVGACTSGDIRTGDAGFGDPDLSAISVSQSLCCAHRGRLRCETQLKGCQCWIGPRRFSVGQTLS